MHDRMPVASTELTHDQASRNWGGGGGGGGGRGGGVGGGAGGGGGEARKDSLIAGVLIRDWPVWLDDWTVMTNREILSTTRLVVVARACWQVEAKCKSLLILCGGGNLLV